MRCFCLSYLLQRCYLFFGEAERGKIAGWELGKAFFVESAFQMFQGQRATLCQPWTVKAVSSGNTYN